MVAAAPTPLATTRRGRPLLYSALGAAFHLDELRPEHEPLLEGVMDRVADWMGDRLNWTHLWCAGFEPFQRSHLDYVSGLAGNLTISDTLPSLPTTARSFGRQLIKSLRVGATVSCGGGEEIEAASPWRCYFRARFRANDDLDDSLLACRAALYLTVEDTWPIDDFYNRICDIASLLPVRWGIAGFTYSWWDYTNVNAARDAFYPHARRHCGYDIAQPVTALDPFYDRLRTVSWLTFVGSTLAGQVDLSKAPPPLVTQQSLTSCTMLQAGGSPQPGDTNRLDMLPAYQQVDALLRPIRERVPDNVLVPGKGWTHQTVTEWLNRFEYQGPSLV